MSLVSKDPLVSWQEVLRTCKTCAGQSVPGLKELWRQAAEDAERMVNGLRRYKSIRAQFQMAENARRTQLRLAEGGGLADHEELFRLTESFQALLMTVEGLEQDLAGWEIAACRSWRAVREAEKRFSGASLRVLR